MKGKENTFALRRSLSHAVRLYHLCLLFGYLWALILRTKNWFVKAKYYSIISNFQSYPNHWNNNTPKHSHKNLFSHTQFLRLILYMQLIFKKSLKCPALDGGRGGAVVHVSLYRYVVHVSLYRDQKFHCIGTRRALCTESICQGKKSVFWGSKNSDQWSRDLGSRLDCAVLLSK